MKYKFELFRINVAVILNTTVALAALQHLHLRYYIISVSQGLIIHRMRLTIPQTSRQHLGKNFCLDDTLSSVSDMLAYE